MLRFRHFVIAGLLAALFWVSDWSVTQVTASSLVTPTIPNQSVVTWQPGLAHPTFLRGPISLPVGAQAAAADDAAVAQSFLAAYRQLWGLRDVAGELQTFQSTRDQLGISHVTFQQVMHGIPVYNAVIKVHFSRAANEVVAVGNGFVADLPVFSVTPQVTATTALQVAQALLPSATKLTPPTLVIYPGVGAQRSAQQARLAWLVEVQSPTDHLLFVIDATTGKLFDVLERNYDINYDMGAHLSLNKPNIQASVAVTVTVQALATYSAQNRQFLPGVLMRVDDQPLVGDIDVDNAHDFAKATLAYYLTTHDRHSFDDKGAIITSTVHYGRNLQNAYWDGAQMVYGDGFPKLDVVGHELTHAVTQSTANLEYRWQSGALNESFSDIFGAMIDREDWLIGEDIAPDAFGQQAFRDMADPERFNQPGHTEQWVKTCYDQEGVHTNSGIFNKAYYNIATAIGKENAERIFYRTLVHYLQATSSFQDARTAVLQATADLYPTLTLSVTQGFDNVGMTASWQPVANECGCVALATATTAQEQSVATLYAVRDRLLATTVNGRYYTDLYYKTTADITTLLLTDVNLRARTNQIVRMVTPGLHNLLIGQGNDSRVTQEMVDGIVAYLADLQQTARAAGNLQLATQIATERARIDWARLPNMTFAEAWSYLNQTTIIFQQFLPAIQQ